MQENRFITVPAVTLPGSALTIPSFQVGQYACTEGESGKAAVTAEDKPWVNINYATARQACKNAGFELITELQWLAIAHDVAAQPCNWNTGIVGKGRLFQGLRNNSVDSAQPGNYEPEDPDEQRWLTLSNGELICDLNGNVWQWVFDNIQGDSNGIVAEKLSKQSGSLSAPFPSMKNGIGWRPEAGSNWSGDALIRGGYWGSESVAGAFNLGGVWPDRESDGVGFRCTKPGL